MNSPKDKTMSAWFWYAIGAAVLYGLHQVFTKMASYRIGDGVGGFVVEASATLTDDFGRWRGIDGSGWHFLFPRASIDAPRAWHCHGHWRSVFITEVRVTMMRPNLALQRTAAGAP
jgi:hypothetical protein